MMSDEAPLSYRRSAVQEASSPGLMVILNDMLVSDLCSAITGMVDGRIEERCERLKHAFLVLQVLEASLDMKSGGEAAANLSRFYAFLRSQLLTAQFTGDLHTLEEIVALVLDVREAWCQADVPRAADAGRNPAPLLQSSAAPANAVIIPESVGWSA